VCGAGAVKISQTPAGADKKFQPAQDSSTCTIDHIHVTHVHVYVHVPAQVDVIADKAMQKVKQTCWS